ncbi:MAG: DUF2341 domain-containing protein [Fibrobacteria bacterium]|nr:DUF2341 domain-containing protein [Fibrobacteria bacterium]
MGQDTAGTASGGESIEVAGIISVNSGAHMTNTVVTLYPKTYNPYLDGTVPDSLVDTTDEEGIYRFENVETGSYNIKAVSAKGLMLALKQGINITEKKDTTITLSEMFLKPPGKINVSLQEVSAKEGDYVCLPGTGVSALINTQNVTEQLVAVSDVPVGSYRELVYGDSVGANLNLLDSSLEVVSDSLSVVAPYRAWNKSKKIIINTSVSGADIKEMLVNYPLLVRLDSSHFSFSDAKSDGGDIRFSTSAGKVLQYEVEYWDLENKKAELWILVDTILGDNSEQFITMHWDNATVAEGEDGAAVFDTADGFTGVWHLGETGATDSDGFKDATANGDHGTGVSLDMSSSGSSVVGSGQTFDGIDDYVDLGESQGLDGVTSFSVSFWCLADTVAFSSFAGILARGTEERLGAPYVYGVVGDSSIRMTFTTLDVEGDGDVVTAPLEQGKWHYVSFTWDGNVVTAYLDGVPGATDTTTGTVLRTSDGNNWIGAMPGWGKWDGKLDEMRISSLPRSADWVKFCYETQKPGTTILKFK